MNRLCRSAASIARCAQDQLAECIGQQVARHKDLFSSKKFLFIFCLDWPSSFAGGY